jgi:hypothetical protein
MPESPYPGPPPPGPDPDGAPAAGPPDAPAPDAPAPPPVCAVCGAQLDPDQTYCLECGAPTKLAPRLRRGAGGLAAIAAGLAILGAGAGALAYVASQDGAGGAASTVRTSDTSSIITVPTTPVPTTETDSSLPGDTTGTLPMDTTFTSPGADTTAIPPDSGMLTETGPGVDGQTTSSVIPDPGTGSSGTDDWPAGTAGWTTIVASDSTESGARAAANRLQSQGQPGGVLWSSDHPPLNPGYWVAFSGTFTTRGEALSHARSLVGNFPGAYPRKVDS